MEKNKPAAEWPSEGVVEFNDFSIKYREELDFVLKNISIKINSGEKVNKKISLQKILVIVFIYLLNFFKDWHSR